MQLARLREWREAQGMTQRQLGAAANVGQKTIVRIERGEGTIPTTASRLAAALGVEVADLLENPPVPLVNFHVRGRLEARGEVRDMLDELYRQEITPEEAMPKFERMLEEASNS